MQLIETRVRESHKMSQILWLMMGVSTFSFIISVWKFIFYSSDCNPKIIAHWFASLVDAITLFVNRQLWVYVVCASFWPT